MALDNATIDRLKSQLLTSGLQDRNQALFQIINQLIDSQRNIITSINDTNAAIAALPIQVYAVTNAAVDRSYDAPTVLIAELADVVGTLISDLKARGIVK